jgi:hypothetical protein
MKKVLCFLMTVTALYLFAGNSDAEWSKIYESTYSSSEARSIRATSDGGYIVAGGYGYSILKLYSNGAIEWQKIYTIELSDHATSVQPTADGGYIVTGISDWNYWNEKMWILKLNADGASEWQKTYTSDEGPYPEGNDIQQTVDANMTPDGFIAAGVSSGFGIWVLKLNLDGSLDWQRSYSGEGAPSIRQTFDPNGSPTGFILAGNNSYGLWVIKLNSDGLIDWERTYGYTGLTRSLNCIRPISGGGYIIVGESRTADSFSNDVLVARLAEDGAIVWHGSYGGEGREVGYEVVESRDAQNNPDGFVVAGFTESFGKGGQDAWVFKVDGDGNLQWQKTYGGGENDVAHSLDRAHGGGYVLAGSTWSFGSNVHFWILQINENGEIPYCSAMGSSQAIVNEPEVFDPSTYTPVVGVPDPTVTTTDATPETGAFVMTPICSLAGDFNMDDAVNASDLVVFVPGYGTTDCGSGEPCSGDIDSDGDRDGKDLSILAKTYGGSN